MNWTEKKYKKAIEDKNNARSLATVFALGVVEGIVDMAVMIGVTLVVVGTAVDVMKVIKKI